MSHRPARRAAEVEVALPEGRGAVVPPGSGLLAIALTGLVLGLTATAVVLDHGWDPGAVAIGPWVTQPRVGTVAIDPYAQAALARSGGVPMAAGEGLRFTAATDDTGYRLLPSCSYRLGDAMPPARFWTLTATDAEGRALDTAARRSAFTSTDVVRDMTGRFTIAIAPEARPGNWLPLSGAAPMVLTLRLYDTPLAGNPAEIAGAPLPALVRLGCGPAVAAPEGRIR